MNTIIRSYTHLENHFINETGPAYYSQKSGKCK